MKRFYMLLLLVVVVMNCLYASVHTGSCGPNVTYSLDMTTGVLTISGTGAMYDYKAIESPWASKQSYIKRVIIEDGVTTIGDSAFEWCTSLSSVTIGNTVLNIGDYAFFVCKKLSSLTIPDSVTSIGYRAFDGCTNLSSVVIGNSVTSIGDYAFHECTSLSSITIGNSVRNIGEGAFWLCESLTELLIPGSVVYIEEEFVRSCRNLTKLFMFPKGDFRDCLDGWSGNLYMQELTMKQEEIFNNTTDNIYSLADYYIETRSELTNGIFKVSLTPRYENVTIN